MENRTRKAEHAAHGLAWLGGIFIALTPFVRAWTLVLGANRVPVRLWPGNFIVELLVGGGLVVLGGMLGGAWWCRAGRRQRRWGAASAAIVLGWGLAGCFGWLLPWVYWSGTAGLLLVAGAACLRTGVQWQFPGMAQPWNGVFWGLLLVLSVVSDCIVVGQVEGGAPAVLGLVLARVLTQVVLVALLWFCWSLFLRWAPRGTHWLGGLALGFALVAIGAEIGMRKLWGKGLVLFFGELAVGGKFDLLRVLEGGGIRLSVTGWLGVVGALLVVSGVYVGTWLISQRLGMRLRPKVSLQVALAAWVLLLAEQGSEPFWISRAGRWSQRRACMIHLCPGEFSSDESLPGLASFAVEFREPQLPSALALTRRPDVFWFIVETLRGDGVRPEIMPFVSQWRDTECQPQLESRAASNATHLSWYAMLSGKPPVFWDKDRQAQRPAPLLALLHAAGYRNEVRSAAIFNYVEMDTTNFGHGEATDVLVSLPPDGAGWPPGIGERDLQVMGQWRHSVLTEQAGATLRLVAVESPHYPYNWGADFTPPFADYAQSSWFPLHPSPQDTEKVKHRYWNSLAWVDTLLRDYVGFLKEHNRYDDAMIIVTGDHGEELQEHGTWFHASGLTPEQISVPVIVKWPKALGRGEPVAQASHLDLMPSVLDALGCPQAQWADLAGHSLRQGGEHTLLVMTHFASQNGEGMIWRRMGYEAAFAWKKIWVPGLPRRLWLERISGPQGKLKFDSSAAADAALREHFPDAINRWFVSFEREKALD
jgi:hypothetical protein